MTNQVGSPEWLKEVEMDSLEKRTKGELVTGGNKFGLGVVVGGALMFFFSGIIHMLFLIALVALAVYGAVSIIRRI